MKEIKTKYQKLNNHCFSSFKKLFILFHIIFCLSYSIPCFSATLQSIEQKLNAIQMKFSYSPEKVNHWKGLFRNIGDLADLENLEKAIQNCTEEAPNLITPCLNFIANFNYSVLRNLKIANQKKIAFYFNQNETTFSRLVRIFQNSAVMEEEDIELLTRYLRKAQDKGWLEELKDADDLHYSIYLGAKAPNRFLKDEPGKFWEDKPISEKFFKLFLFSFPEYFNGVFPRIISNWKELYGSYLFLIEKYTSQLINFVFNLNDLGTIEFQPNQGPIAFRTLSNNIDMLIAATAFHSAGAEAYLEAFEISLKFSQDFQLAGHNYSIKILPILQLFKSLGYTEPDFYELARTLDKSTYQKLKSNFSSPSEIEIRSREEFSHFLKEFRSHSEDYTQDIPINKMAQFLANSPNGIGFFNEFLAQIKKSPLPILREVFEKAPYIVLDHFTEKAAQESSNLLKENPQQWGQNLLDWMKLNPESTNPKLNILFFEATKGRWESIQNKLETTLPSSQRSSNKIKNWFMESLSGDDGFVIRQFLNQLEQSREPSDFEIFAVMIQNFSSPLLHQFLVSSEVSSLEGSKLTHFLKKMKKFLIYAQFHGILEQRDWTEETLSKAKEEFHAQEFMNKIDVSKLNSEEKSDLSKIIKRNILSKANLVSSYEDLLKRIPTPINSKWFLISEKYRDYFIPALLRHHEEDPELTMQKIKFHTEEINIPLDALDQYAALDRGTFIPELMNVLAEDTDLIESLKNHVYEITSSFPRNKKLYRWGEKTFEKGRITGAPFSLKDGNRSYQAYGTGFYLAEDPLSSASFGVNAEDPYLIEVTLPEDTHLLDLSTPETRSEIWRDLRSHPLILKSKVSEEDFDLIISFINPKSIVIRTDNQLNNGHYVYKTSKIGSKEKVSKPQLSLDQLTSATPDTDLSKPGQESALTAHIFKRLVPSDVRMSSPKDPKTSFRFDFGVLYHVLEETGTPFAIESRESIKKRKSFRCQVKGNKAIIATSGETKVDESNTVPAHELDYETFASSCEQLNGTWKNGFICEPNGEGFKWIDLHAAFESPSLIENSPFFHSESECQEAGNRRNLFWRCLPQSSTSTLSSYFSIQTEYLYSNLNWLNKAGSSFSNGQFTSFQSCMKSLDNMSFGLVCLPQAQGFALSSLFHHDYEQRHFNTFEACQSTLETQVHSVVSNQLPQESTHLSPLELLKKFNHIPVIQKLMAESNTERGSLEFHSVEVLKHWDQRVQNWDGTLHSSLNVLSENLEITRERLNSILRTAILFHDLGKPLSHPLQHLTTVELAKSIFEKMELNHREVEVGLSLIDQDLIGNFLKNKRTKGAQRALKFQIKSLARVLGVDPNAWYQIMLEFYTADASFYPVLRESLFTSLPNDHLEIKEPLLKDLTGKLK